MTKKSVQILNELVEKKKDRVEKLQSEATKLENAALRLRFEILELNGELHGLETLSKGVDKEKTPTKSKRGRKPKVKNSKKVEAVESKNETKMKKAS